MQGTDSNHVGIVAAVNGNKITVIEGNTGKDIVKKNVYTVQNKTTKNGECFGYVGKWNNAKNYFCGYISVN